MIFAKLNSLLYRVMYVSVCNLDQSPDRSRLPAMAYFFYGTLCDADVLQLVLGYRPGPGQLKPALLPGYRRKRARGHSFPVLLRAPGGLVDGLLFRPARASDAPRLTTYEGPDYVTRRLPVCRQAASGAAVSRARVFLPAGSSLPADFDDWALPRWQQRDKAAFLRSLQDQGPIPCTS
jgi:ADP-ribose pyrophosphatase